MELYDKLFIENGDKRVENDVLMKDPFLVLIIVAIYLWTVAYLLPKYMEHRKAYCLKIIIQFYNIMQVIVCCYQVYGLAVNGWLTSYSFICEPVDYSNDPIALKMLHYTYVNLFVKMIELVETVFFRLRKKDNQVSYLHVYHHSSTFCFAWITYKYAGGGSATYPIFINSIIHIIMYIYYFLSALGPNVQPKLTWIKKKITTMQLVQFALILFYNALVMLPSCPISNYFAISFFVNICILVAFFINFYIKSYNKKRDIQKTF